MGRRGEALFVDLLPAVRNAWDWLAPAGVELYNAFVRRKSSGASVPHAFTFKLRKDLNEKEMEMMQRASHVPGPGVEGVEGGLRGPASGNDPFDVMALVKTFMSDYHLQQPPILVLPAARACRVAPGPSALVPRAEVTDRRKQELKVFADVLQLPAYNLLDAAAYVRGLMAPRQAISDLPALSWLVSQAGVPPGVSHTDNGHFAHLPEAPWHLKVRYKRLGNWAGRS